MDVSHASIIMQIKGTEKRIVKYRYHSTISYEGGDGLSIILRKKSEDAKELTNLGVEV